MNPEPENPETVDGRAEALETTAPEAPSAGSLPAAEPGETRFLKWMLFGPDGLRAGWSVTVFLLLTLIFMSLLGLVAMRIVPQSMRAHGNQMTPASGLVQEVIQVAGIYLAMIVCALMERRRLSAYYFAGTRRITFFVSGLVGGFAALSALVGALYVGGWIRFLNPALAGSAILGYALLWAAVFLMTGFAEEGSVRCFLLYTLTRGLNLWWALGLIGLMCLNGILFIHNQGIWGVYLMAALGMVPCAYLALRRAPSAGFWLATWVTSTFFGFMHTGNGGETWIGIFSAAAIGFVFCVSIRLTGSAWWAIGFHAAWDWAQTYFYGTPDSGFVAQGHYLTTIPSGNVIWSGGTAGPEGSALILPTTLLTLVAILALYGRRPPSLAVTGSAETVARTS